MLQMYTYVLQIYANLINVYFMCQQSDNIDNVRESLRNMIDQHEFKTIPDECDIQGLPTIVWPVKPGKFITAKKAEYLH